MVLPSSVLSECQCVCGGSLRLVARLTVGCSLLLPASSFGADTNDELWTCGSRFTNVPVSSDGVRCRAIQPRHRVNRIAEAAFRRLGVPDAPAGSGAPLSPGARGARDARAPSRRPPTVRAARVSPARPALTSSVLERCPNTRRRGIPDDRGCSCVVEGTVRAEYPRPFEVVITRGALTTDTLPVTTRRNALPARWKVTLTGKCRGATVTLRPAR